MLHLFNLTNFAWYGPGSERRVSEARTPAYQGGSEGGGFITPSPPVCLFGLR